MKTLKMNAMENRFPHFIGEEDHFAMSVLCQEELVRWRVAVAHHKALPTVNKKLENRKFLEQSFDLLKIAWEKANRPAETMAAA